jgi:predicted membrane metal-binding protein
LELKNGEKIYANIPAHYSILLSREIYFEKPIFQNGTLFQSSRGIVGEIQYSSFQLGELQKKYYLLHLKSAIIERIRKIFPTPESALLNGILVGDDSLMDEDFSDLYRKIGLSHITVVSGSNIAAVLAILCILFQKISTIFRM